MVVTGHVAVVSCVLRAYFRPTDPATSIAVGVPLSIGLAVFLSWPIGRAITAALRPGPGLDGGPCPGCGDVALRPLSRTRGRLPPVVAGLRCGSCMTTFRTVDGEVIAERPPGEAEPAGIVFLGEAGPELELESGVRFLDD